MSSLSEDSITHGSSRLVQLERADNIHIYNLKKLYNCLHLCLETNYRLAECETNFITFYFHR